MAFSFQILPGLPPDGPTAVPFGAGGWTVAWGGHREGLVIRFRSGSNETWVANFQPGGGGWEGVLEHPNRQHVIVVSRGQGYVVDPASHQLVQTFSGSVQLVVEVPSLKAILLSDGLGFEAINSEGTWWTSRRIAWDGIRAIKVQGTTLRGEASSPVGGSETWVPFTLDLMTGQCHDGTYERDMRSAIPIKPAPSNRD